MIIKEKVINESYKNYITANKKKKDNWVLGNDVLYNLCKKHPLNIYEHEIVAKIWLIGRSYAAAIERTKDKRDISEPVEDFYYDKVVPEMQKIGTQLDKELKVISKKTSIEKNISTILRTHKMLTDTFCRISGFEKRSLASKYLHFHCRNMFFIYDSRSSEAVKKIIQRPDIKAYGKMSYDPEYASFVCRMICLKKYLEKEFNKKISPRELDSFLLSGEIQKTVE